MSNRNVILLVVAVMIAGAVAFGLKSRMRAPQETQVAEQKQNRILVARSDLPAGAFVKTGTDLGWSSWPASAMQPSYIAEGSEDISSFQGAVTRRPIKAGEPINSGALVKPGAGGFLSAVLEPSKRAVSIAVTATSGNAGFIFPGDRVDLIVTHRVKSRAIQGANEEETVVSETFVSNVRVVAVDQLLDNPENKAILAKTLTVEVSQEEAQRVAVAEDLGKISVALRSIANDQAAQPTAGAEMQPVGDSFIDAMQSSPPAPPSKSFSRDSEVSTMLDRKSDINPRVLVIRGDQSEQREFVQEPK